LDNFSVDGLALLAGVFRDVVFICRMLLLLLSELLVLLLAGEVFVVVAVVVRIRIELSWVILLFEELFASVA